MSSEDASSDVRYEDSDDEVEESQTNYDEDEEEENEERDREERDKQREGDEASESTLGFSKIITKFAREADTATPQKAGSGTKPHGSDSLSQTRSGDEEGEKIKELYYNTFVENGPTGLGIMDALQISVVLEEMSDQLDIIGMSIDAPQVDLRSRESVAFDQAVHRPKVTIPAEFDPYSNSLFKEKYILRQHYSTVAARRIEQMCTNTAGVNIRRRLTKVLRDFGVHRFSLKGKVQAERTQMNIILDNVATELIQDFTFSSLISAIDQEREKYEGMKIKVEKSMKDAQYITESKHMLKRLRIEKRKARKDMQDKMWEFEDNRQELLKRKELEYLYVNHNAVMTKARMKKMCAKAESTIDDIMERNNAKRDHYENAHYLMLDTIYKKYKEAQHRLEYWVEKYEIDKDALQAALDQMKADRARDLERIEWLKAMIRDYEQIVMDDRRIKQIEADRLKMERVKNRKATKIQAWWRGEMYRKELGPWNPRYQEKKAKMKGEKKKK